MSLKSTKIDQVVCTFGANSAFSSFAAAIHNGFGNGIGAKLCLLLRRPKMIHRFSMNSVPSAKFLNEASICEWFFFAECFDFFKLNVNIVTVSKDVSNHTRT